MLYNRPWPVQHMLSYYQVVRRDLHDWDVDAAPVLITTKSGRKIVASANKDGLLRVMDRSTVKPGASEDMSLTLQYLYSVPTTTRINTDIPLSRERPTYLKQAYWAVSNGMDLPVVRISI